LIYLYKKKKYFAQKNIFLSGRIILKKSTSLVYNGTMEIIYLNHNLGGVMCEKAC
jgi:hypothetical protein